MNPKEANDVEETMGQCAQDVGRIPSIAASAMQRIANLKPPRPRATRRTVMQWGLAAAACLAAALVMFLLTTGQSAYAQLAKALATTRAAQWVHMTGTRSGQKFEAWISCSPLRLYSTTDGKVIFSDGDQKRTWSYTPDNHTVTIYPNEGDDAVLGGSGDFSQNMLAELERHAKQAGAEVAKSEKIIDGVTYLAYVLPGGKDPERESIEILVVPQTGRIARFIIRDAATIVDYPPDGPKDMYALGVPADAKIVDLMPTPGVLELDQKVEAARKAFAPTYFAIICFVPVTQVNGGEDKAQRDRLQIHAVYKRDGRFRIEGYVGGWMGKTVTVALDDMRGLEQWIKTQPPGSVDFISASGDAQTMSLDRENQLLRVEPVHYSFSESTVEGLTWGDHFTSRGASVVKEGPMLIRSHGPMKLQYDSLRDFALTRLERDRGVDAAGGNMSSATVFIESWRQTPKGQWYAQKVRRIMTSEGDAPNKKVDLSFVSVVNLDTERSIPLDLVDPAKVSPNIFRRTTQTGQP